MFDFIFNDMLDNLQDTFYFLSEEPKVFYRKYRRGKKIYKTRKMFCYNEIKDYFITPTKFAINMFNRRF